MPDIPRDGDDASLEPQPARRAGQVALTFDDLMLLWRLAVL